jgi:hypothetical protein
MLSLVLQVMKMGPVGVPKMFAASSFPVLCNCPKTEDFIRITAEGKIGPVLEVQCCNQSK